MVTSLLTQSTFYSDLFPPEGNRSADAQSCAFRCCRVGNLDLPLVVDLACRKRRYELRLLYAPFLLFPFLTLMLPCFLSDFCGTIIGAPVIPVMLVVLWSKLNKPAVLAGSMGGTALAIMAWLLTGRYYYGSVNVDNLISSYSCLAGNMVSLCTGGIIAAVISLIKPDNYDFKGTKNSQSFLQH